MSTADTREHAEFIVGLDFGTSTIKCVLLSITGKKRERRQRHVIEIDGAALFPSVVWEMPEGLLKFGHRPRNAKRAYRSIKSFLIRSAFPEEMDPRFTEHLDFRKAEVLTWCLLNYASTRVSEAIYKLYPEAQYTYDWDKNVFWNMGVPLEGVADQDQRLRFLRILYLATRTEGGLIWTHDLTSLTETFEAQISGRLPECQEVGGFACLGNCFIFCEAHVAVNAFRALEGNVNSGLYYVCDVGAGTTDIAFFRYAPTLPRPIVFYASVSIRTGGDDCAVMEAERLVAANQEMPWHRAFENGLEKVLHSADGSRPYGRVYDRLREGQQLGFRLAYPKEPGFERWHKGLEREGGAAVFGGGSYIPGIPEACLAQIPTGNGRETIRPEAIELKKKLPVGMSELHRIAYGLSIPAWEFFESWPPDMVPDFKPPMPRMYNPFPSGSPYDL